MSKDSLTPDELNHLFSIAISSVRGTLHGFRNAITGVMESHNLLTMINDGELPDVSISEVLKIQKTSLQAAMNCVDFALEPLGRFSPHKSHPFQTNLAAIFQRLIETYRTVLTIKGPIEENLCLVYPPSAFYVVIDELIANAVKHHHARPEITLIWEIRSFKFVCTIEDNGSGLTASLGDSYLPLSHLLEKWWETGLGAVQNIVDASDGLLLFSKGALGIGTRALLEIPFLGYFEGEEVRRPNA